MLASPPRPLPRQDAPVTAGTAGPRPLLLLSTEGIEQRHRLDYWIGAISEALFELKSASREPATFSSSLAAAALDNLYIIQTDGTERETFRTREAISKSRDYSFHLIVQHRHVTLMEWCGMTFTLRPGDLFIGDTRVRHAGRRLIDSTYIKLPADWARTWLRQPERLTGRVIPGDVGWGAVLSNFLRELTPRFAINAPLPPKVLADHFGALLALIETELFEGQVPQPGAEDAIRQVRKAIRDRAGEPLLTASEIAADCGLPEPTMHRLLLAIGTTFAALVLECRMDIARGLLDAERFRRLSISEVALRSGFTDASYFIRTATPQLGATPARYRAARVR